MTHRPIRNNYCGRIKYHEYSNASNYSTERAGASDLIAIRKKIRRPENLSFLFVEVISMRIRYDWNLATIILLWFFNHHLDMKYSRTNLCVGAAILVTPNGAWAF